MEPVGALGQSVMVSSDFPLNTMYWRFGDGASATQPATSPFLAPPALLVDGPNAAGGEDPDGWTGDGATCYQRPWEDSALFDRVFNVDNGTAMICVQFQLPTAWAPSGDEALIEAGRWNRGIRIYYNAGGDNFRASVIGENNVASSSSSSVNAGNLLRDRAYNIVVWIDNRQGLKQSMVLINSDGYDPYHLGAHGMLGTVSEITGGADSDPNYRRVTVGADQVQNGGFENYFTGIIRRVWAINYGLNPPVNINQVIVSMNRQQLDF